MKSPVLRIIGPTATVALLLALGLSVVVVVGEVIVSAAPAQELGGSVGQSVEAAHIPTLPATTTATIYLPGIPRNHPLPPRFALQFDGVDDFASIADKGDFDFDKAFTVEAWFKPLSIPPSDGSWEHLGLVLGTESEPPISRLEKTGWKLNQAHDWPPREYKHICFYVGNKGMCLGPLEAGRWDHVAGTYEAGEIHIYHNGDRDTFPRTTQENVAPVNFIILGMQERSFHGLIDEIRIWNIARSQAQIQADMNRMLNGDEPGLVGYWRLDEGSGQAVLDSSPNQNDGRLGISPEPDASDPIWVLSDAPIQ